MPVPSSDTEKRGKLHLIKLSVGTSSLQNLKDWQDSRSAERLAAGLDPRPRHVTRMRPKRAEELLNGGSIFWVIQGELLARQPLLELQDVRGDDGIQRCALIFEPKLIAVQRRPKRAFQGWRYLTQDDAPPDLGEWDEDQASLPDGLREEIAKFGLF